ncbi:MAG: hypothetical protein AAGC47_12190, partial [Bacteroidota bacterium]
GLLLNDLIHSPRPHYLFFGIALLTYIGIGFVLTFVFNYLSMGIGVKMKGGFMGIALGFFIYLIAFVFGISFKGSGTEHVIVDFIWQMIEQGIGGGVIGFVYAMAKRRDRTIKSDTQ